MRSFIAPLAALALAAGTCHAQVTISGDQPRRLRLTTPVFPTAEENLQTSSESLKPAPVPNVSEWATAFCGPLGEGRSRSIQFTIY